MNVKTFVYNPELVTVWWRNNIGVFKIRIIMLKYTHGVRSIFLKLFIEKIKVKVLAYIKHL